ncbi:iron-sulfur cluster assembly scaffold protein [Candidatus Parcubacteria bacterium]|nr:iron-sulfur cluster assembly scaffold protein [Candidatus Parcubacteria bacterium]
MAVPYSSKVMRHFLHPKNMGKIKNADGVGKVGNLRCGDVMWLYIKVGKNKSGKEIIKNIKFETFGCVAALATSSAITELAMGKSLNKALKISRSKIVKNLGGLPPIKIHCSVLAADALAEAIYNYLQKNKREISPDLQKKHEIILKSKEIIEDRYHDWTGLEEKLHQHEN